MSIFAPIPSGPPAFDVSREDSASYTSISEIPIVDKVDAGVGNDSSGGILKELRVNTEEKKLLKSIAFS